MRKAAAYLLITLFTGMLLAGCNTQKPADEVKGAKDRVQKKVEDAREKQEAENPENEQDTEE